MKRLLSVNDLHIYLLAKNVITNDDLAKLTISGQLSKDQVLINLQDIVRTRKVIDQFLEALKHSSEDNPGHKELFDIIHEEKQRRLSIASGLQESVPKLEVHCAASNGLEMIELDSEQANDLEVDSPVTSKPTGKAQESHTDAVGESTGTTTDQVGAIIFGIIII